MYAGIFRDQSGTRSSPSRQQDQGMVSKMKNIMENELKQLGYKFVNGHYCREFGCPFDDNYVKIVYTLEDDIIFLEVEYHHLTLFDGIIISKDKSIVRYKDALKKVEGTNVHIMVLGPKGQQIEHEETLLED